MMMTLLIAPMVSANPFTDLWNWLFPSDDLTNMESSTTILDERTELKCSDDQCQMEIGNPRFIRYNDELMYFKDFSTLSETETKDIRNVQLDGVEITYTPFIIKDGKEIDIKDTSTLGLDYNFINNNEQDFSKFTIEFNRITGLTEFGVRVSSNYPITYKTFNHTVEGVYINIDPKIVEVTNLYTNGREISYVPEIDNGLDVRFDKKTNSMYFTILPSISNEPISIDPIITFNSTSDDGHLVYAMSPFVCIGSSSGGTTSAIAKNYGTMTEAHTIIPFNTSIIPDDATIEQVQLQHYRHSYTSRISSTPLDLWMVNYYYGQTDIGALFCGDGIQITGGQGSINWSAVTGWRTKNVGTITINKTGWTNYKLSPKWVLYGAADEAQANMRTSEYAGYYDPRLVVNYTEAIAGVCTNLYTSGDFNVSGQVNCTTEDFFIDGKLHCLESGELNLFNWTNVTMNQTTRILIDSSLCKILIHPGNKINNVSILT